MLASFITLLLSASPLTVPYERYVLPNGLTVILHEDHSLPTVVVDTLYAVGSADEKSGKTGFAHLFEHLMFMGTHNVPNSQFDQLMEQVGGSNNATTSQDRTHYYESGPSNLLETFLWLEGDRMANLGADMTRAKVDLQRDVVKNERRQSIENRPYGSSELIVVDKLFPVGHPYHHPVIGSHADLTAASVDDVKFFFRRFYVPANAALVIAGDFESGEAKRLVEKYLGVLPRVEAPPRVALPFVSLPKPVRVVQPDAIQQERVEMHWLAPSEHGRGSAECEVLANVLGGGKSSRLVKSVVIDQKLAEDVEVGFEGAIGQSIFTIAATAQGAHTAAEVEKAINVELAKLLTSPPTEAEVARSRARLQTERLTQLEDLSVRAALLSHAEMELGDPGEVPRLVSGRLDGVNASGVLEVTRSVLGMPRLTTTFVPKGKR